MVFLSGQIALDEKGNLHTSDITTETRRVMESIPGILLKAAGLGYEHLVKVTIFLSDMAHYAANEVYGTYFSDVPPAREAVAVKGLPRGVNVEISGIANGDLHSTHPEKKYPLLQAGFLNNRVLKPYFICFKLSA